jgi:hypothetical protein
MAIHFKSGLVLLGLVALAGCSPGTGSISGVVTKQGQPVRSGLITFLNVDGRGSALAQIDREGHYYAPSVPAGEATIILVNTLEEPDFGKIVNPRATNPLQPPPVKKGPSRPRLPTVIPARYAKPETSGLKTTITTGENTFDIEVVP